MRNRFPGICFICKKLVCSDKGYFQSVGSLPKELRGNYTGANYRGKWLLRCSKCVGKGNQTNPINKEI